MGRARRRRRHRVDRPLHLQGDGQRPPRGRRQAGHHLRPGHGRRRHLRGRRQRRPVRPGHGLRRVERLVHDELLRPHGQGPRRRLRRRVGPDDHRARLHQRPEPARPAPQGPPPGPGRRRQHRAGVLRGGPGHEPGARVHEGPPRRCGPPGADPRRVDHRLHRGHPGRGDRRAGQRRLPGRRLVRSRSPRSSSTPRTRSSRATSSAARPRAPSTPASPWSCRRPRGSRWSR